MSFFTRRQSSTSSKTGSTTPASPFSARKVAQEKIPEWEEVLKIDNEELRIWRVGDKEQLTAVPPENYGFFYNKENYIVLKAFNHKKRLCYNIHFWFGSEKAKKGSTPPSKVQQLIQLLNERVVVYREVEGFESPVFRRYFNVFGVHIGDIQEAFDPQHPEKFKKRLLHFRENRVKSRVEVREVVVSKKSLRSGDVYIFDEGTKMTQWNGKKCDESERLSAKKYVENALKLRKTTCTSEFHDEEDLFPGNDLYKKLGDADSKSPPMKLNKDTFKKTMYRLAEKSGKMSLTQVSVSRSNIFPEDVAVVDARSVLYVQIGPSTSDLEKSSVWTEADKYLKSADAPNKSICVFVAGSYCQPFEEVWGKKE